MAQGQSLYLWSSRLSGTPPVLTYWSFDVWHLCTDRNHAEVIGTAAIVFRMSGSWRFSVGRKSVFLCFVQSFGRVQRRWLTCAGCSVLYLLWPRGWEDATQRLLSSSLNSTALAIGFFSPFMERFPIPQVSEIFLSSSQQKFSPLKNLQ